MKKFDSSLSAGKSKISLFSPNSEKKVRKRFTYEDSLYLVDAGFNDFMNWLITCSDSEVGCCFRFYLPYGLQRSMLSKCPCWMSRPTQERTCPLDSTFPQRKLYSIHLHPGMMCYNCMNLILQYHVRYQLTQITFLCHFFFNCSNKNKTVWTVLGLSIRKRINGPCILN